MNKSDVSIRMNDSVDDIPSPYHQNEIKDDNNNKNNETTKVRMRYINTNRLKPVHCDRVVVNPEIYKWLGKVICGCSALLYVIISRFQIMILLLLFSACLWILYPYIAHYMDYMLHFITINVVNNNENNGEALLNV